MTRIWTLALATTIALLGAAAPGQDKEARTAPPRPGVQRAKERHESIQERKAERRAAVQDRVDQDGNGRISAEERAEARMHFDALREQRWMRQSWDEFAAEHPEAAARILDKADRNDDGEVDLHERRAAVLRYHEERWHYFVRRHPGLVADLARGGVDRARAKADTDGSGTLETAEKLAARRAMEKAAWERFAREHPEQARLMKEKADRDQDGQIDPAEAARARAAVKERLDRNDDGRVQHTEVRKARRDANQAKPR